MIQLDFPTHLLWFKERLEAFGDVTSGRPQEELIGDRWLLGGRGKLSIAAESSRTCHILFIVVCHLILNITKKHLQIKNSFILIKFFIQILTSPKH